MCVKNKKLLNGRKGLVELAFTDKKQAVEYLRKAANTLESCDTTSQIMYCLSDVLFLTPNTLYRDLRNVRTENARK